MNKQKPVLRTGNLGSDLSHKKHNKTKQNKKKLNQTKQKIRFKGPTSLSYNLQKKNAGLQINKLHNYQQFNKHSFFILFTMVVLFDI